MSQNKKSFKLEDLYLYKDSPLIPYSHDFKISNVHYGQLKLFLTTLFFLTKHVKKEHDTPTILIVGAGGSGGSTNNKLIADMFPTYKFVYYDPQGFGFVEQHNIKLYEEFFTDETCKLYKNLNDLYFMSDIRTVGNQEYGTEEYNKDKEENVEENLRMQERWHENLSPVASSLKFRMTFDLYDNNLTYKYLDGEIMLQPYAGTKSTETRLIVIGSNKKKVYEAQKYRDQTFYHNVITRRRKFKNYVEKNDTLYYPPELTDNYDDTCFVAIMSLYLKDRHNIAEPTKIKDYIKETLHFFTSKGRTLQVERKNIHILHNKIKK